MRVPDGQNGRFSKSPRILRIAFELTKGKEDVYVGWWFENRVFKPGVIPQKDVDAYVHAYAREGRMDAAFDYYRTR